MEKRIKYLDVNCGNKYLKLDLFYREFEVKVNHFQWTMFSVLEILENVTLVIGNCVYFEEFL